jgi:hypothetical protein
MRQVQLLLPGKPPQEGGEDESDSGADGESDLLVHVLSFVLEI